MNRNTDDNKNTDTEGHVTRGRGVDEAETEGHMPRIKIPADQAADVDDTEGNLARPGRIEEADTEGHMPLKRGVEEADTATDDADTEGHRFSRG